MDNASYNHSTDTRRSEGYIVLPFEGGQRMLEHWKFQWSYGNYSWTQVTIYNNIISLFTSSMLGYYFRT